MPQDVLLGRDHLVIAEIAQAHDGNVDVAHQLIDSASAAGVHAVKFQTHLAAAESTHREPWRVKFSSRDSDRYAYWKRMEFTVSQWKELKAHCDEANVEFMSSPFSPQAIDLLMGIGVRLWKVASGEVSNAQLLERLSDTGLPVILSSGLSTMLELRKAVEIVGRHSNELAILQCATQYPTPPDQVGLNVIEEFRREFDCIVGISDHTATIFASIAAVALGARVVETHIKADDDHTGPDASSSLTRLQLTELVKGVAFVRAAVTSNVDKYSLTSDQERLRVIFGRSLVAARPLGVGHVLAREDFAYKKPGGGLRYEDLSELEGQRLRRSVMADEPLGRDDVEMNS
jgi:N-acetylneuraminate synthase